MSWLDKITPINLQEEKTKFLADQTYNPQFIYEETVEAKDLKKYGLPQKKYLDLAQEILDQAYFGRNEADLLMMEGPILSQAEVTKRFQTFVKMHNLQDRYQIVWSSSFISRATISDTTIKLRTNATFHRDAVIGLLYHEIGTHALRSINYQQQPWYKKKKEFGLTHNYLRTEEGLATLHALLPRSFPSAYTLAIRYLAVQYAQSHSLSQLWNYLGSYIQDLETRWMVTVRQYRGAADTSQQSGITKDLVYLEGFVEVWRWLKQNNWDVNKLYFGKISFRDADLAEKLNPSFQPTLPSFYTLDREKYIQKLEKIGQVNFLGEKI